MLETRHSYQRLNNNVKCYFVPFIILASITKNDCSVSLFLESPQMRNFQNNFRISGEALFLNIYLCFLCNAFDTLFLSDNMASRSSLIYNAFFDLISYTSTSLDWLKDISKPTRYSKITSFFHVVYRPLCPLSCLLKLSRLVICEKYYAYNFVDI